MRYLYNEGGYKIAQRVKMFPKYAERSIYRHCKLPVEESNIVDDKRKFNKGRPRKVDVRGERKILRTIPRLRKTVGSFFTSKRLQEECGVSHVCNRTRRRILNKHKYFYTVKRKKGIVTFNDRKKRMAFVRRCKRFGPELWTQRISFYFDGVGFAHKTNPKDEAWALGSKAWKTAGEGLSVTGKGSKVGSGGRVVKFFVAISYGKGVVYCRQYKGRMNGEKFAAIAGEEEFAEAFKNSANRKNKLFLQDGDPNQNSAVAQEVFEKKGYKVFKIPARSPDLNPIENVFDNVRRKKASDALRKDITYEDLQTFTARVERTIKGYSQKVIDRTIESMPKPLKLIEKSNGKRIRY